MGAKELQATGLIHSAMSENCISALLDQHMRAGRLASNSSDIISWFMRTLIPGGSQRSPSLVEPDFLFTWGPYPSREDPSLVVEAKRLRGAGSSLAGSYVDEGIIRYVEGSYGRGHDYGIMMGYVVVASVPSAISRVSAAMNRRRNRTQQLLPLAPNNSACAYPYTHHSSHMQQISNQAITLVHIFIDFS